MYTASDRKLNVSLSRGTDLMDKVLIASFPDQPHFSTPGYESRTHVHTCALDSFPDQPHLGTSLGHMCTRGEPEESLKHRLKKINFFMCMLTLHVIV